MKKIISLLLVFGSIVCFASCSDKGKTASDELSSAAEESSDNSREDQLKIRDRSIETDGQFVFDEDEILTGAEFDSLNAYAAWFSKAFKINAAVALTEDIGELSPHDCAEKFYKDNFSGDGILFLINNDTKEDYFYRKGLPAEFISDSDVEILFSEISPMLAMGEYLTAAETVLEEAELSLPEFFTDRTGTLKAEEISEYDKILEEGSEKGTLNIYYVLGTGDDKIEDFAEKRFEMFFEEGKDACMLVIDGENGNSFLCASGSLGYMKDRSEDVKAAVKSLYKKSDGVDLKKAATAFTEIVSEE